MCLTEMLARSLLALSRVLSLDVKVTDLSAEYIRNPLSAMHREIKEGKIH